MVTESQTETESALYNLPGGIGGLMQRAGSAFFPDQFSPRIAPERLGRAINSGLCQDTAALIARNVNPRSHERPTLGASRSAQCDSGDAASAHHRGRLQCAPPHPTSYGDGSCTPHPACAVRPEPRAQSSQGRAAPVGCGPGTRACRCFEALS